MAHHAVHDGRVLGEQSRLAAHQRFGFVQRRPRRQRQGIDRGGVARVETAREPEPATAPHHGQASHDEGQGEAAASTQRRSPIRCSFMRLVVPATHMGEPEMITIRSLTPTVPSPSIVSSI